MKKVCLNCETRGIKLSNESGFSMIEILVVVTVISIMSGAALFYLSSHQTLYQAEDYALKIVDVLQEARQRSLTQRETMRVEIDLTDRLIRLIDENTVTTASDDEIIRSVTIPEPATVRLDTRPSEITSNPPEDFPVPTAQYRQSVYPLSLNNQVSTVRFHSNGGITDAGNNETGDQAVSLGTTIHIWTPVDLESDVHTVARSITVLGSSGSIRLWEYSPNLANNEEWQDSRRTGVYGGGQQSTPTPTP